jgi:hypothetical protein
MGRTEIQRGKTEEKIKMERQRGKMNERGR